MITTLYIVPAWSEQGGKCRIVARPGSWAARYSYMFAPDEWKEVGVMDSRGYLVCLDAPKAVWDRLAADSPLSAGLEITYDEAGCEAPG
jgi:hypothetical protein